MNAFGLYKSERRVNVHAQKGRKKPIKSKLKKKNELN
jgi:hypothetical protein